MTITTLPRPVDRLHNVPQGPAMPGCLHPEAVKTVLKSAGNRFVTVEFLRRDGSVARYNGQLKATRRLGDSVRGMIQGIRMRRDGQIWLALPNGESRSFYLDRVLTIKTNKVRFID